MSYPSISLSPTAMLSVHGPSRLFVPFFNIVSTYCRCTSIIRSSSFIPCNFANSPRFTMEYLCFGFWISVYPPKAHSEGCRITPWNSAGWNSGIPGTLYLSIVFGPDFWILSTRSDSRFRHSMKVSRSFVQTVKKKFRPIGLNLTKRNFLSMAKKGNILRSSKRPSILI